MFTIAKEFVFPDVGEGIHEGTIVKWHAKEGDEVKADSTIVEVETDKAVVELPAPSSGKVLKINFKEGDVVKVGEVLVVIGEAGEKVPEKKKPEHAAAAKEKPEHVTAENIQERILATPATRKLARDLDVDIKTLHGTGPAGRITDDDVKKAAHGVQPAPSAPMTRAPKVVSEEGEERIPLTPVRKIIAERMLFSMTHIPHACGMDFVDVTKLVGIREKEKQKFEPQGVKLTYLPFIIKACAIALKKMPEFNAHFDEAANEIVMKKRFNIGIAVETDDGLMVPVIKDVERKSIIAIAKEIVELAGLARERKIKLEDLKGGTFTITNVGSIGGMYSTPIINPPEIAIMGIQRIKDLPLVIEGNVVPRKVMGISMCFDHRVVDGASATEFMNIVKRHLEDPELLLVEMV